MTKLNLPNQITAARLVISVLVFLAIMVGYFWWALILFLLAAGTDWVDGYVARKYNLVTQLGRILDPFADKILICGCFIFLAAEPNSEIEAWMTVVVVGRELLVTALRSFLEQKGADFSSTMSGKLKMVFQCVAVVASLYLLTHQTTKPAYWLENLTLGIALIAVFMTVKSGTEYVTKAIELVHSEQDAAARKK